MRFNFNENRYGLSRKFYERIFHTSSTEIKNVEEDYSLLLGRALQDILELERGTFYFPSRPYFKTLQGNERPQDTRFLPSSIGLCGDRRSRWQGTQADRECDEEYERTLGVHGLREGGKGLRTNENMPNFSLRLVLMRYVRNIRLRH